MMASGGYSDSANDYAGSTGGKSRIGNALNQPKRFDEIPVKDAFDHLSSAKPNKNAPPPPDKDERARGFVKSRG